MISNPVSTLIAVCILMPGALQRKQALSEFPSQFSVTKAFLVRRDVQPRRALAERARSSTK